MIAALRWHECLGTDPQPADQDAFEIWRSADPEHAAAFARIEQIMALGQSVGSEPEIMALRHETLTRVVMRERTSLRWSVMTGLAASLLLAGGAMWWTLSVSPKPGTPPAAPKIVEATVRSFDTQVGERLNVTLEDGSQLHLDTRTTVQVQYTSAARRLTLMRGQVMFDVAKAPARPFIVAVAGRTVTALGTRFSIRYDDRTMAVALVEGVVTVGKPGDDPAHDVIMRPNDRLVADGQRVSLRHHEDLGRFISWTRGFVQFDNVALSDAVRELNRYTATPLLVDARAGTIRISGSFPTNGSLAFAEAMQAAFPVRAFRSAGGQIFLSYQD
jgi:transmembrane sensor